MKIILLIIKGLGSLFEVKNSENRGKQVAKKAGGRVATRLGRKFKGLRF